MVPGPARAALLQVFALDSQACRAAVAICNNRRHREVEREGSRLLAASLVQELCARAVCRAEQPTDAAKSIID